MIRVLLMLVILGSTLVCSAIAQTGVPDSVYGWRNNLVTGLTLTQVALKDWQQGGEDAFAYTGLVKGSSVDIEAGSIWDSKIELAFGQAQLGEKGVRKTDDRIDLQSMYTYKLYEESKLNPFAAVSLKSQFARGFEYDSAGRPTAVSAFFDPAYLTQSIGASYRPVPEFTTRLGAALREIITSTYTKFADDPATPEIETTLVEGGMESVSNLRWEFAENMLLTSELNIFMPVKQTRNTLVRGSTSIAAKVNEYIAVLVAVEAINDPRVTLRTQIRESLAIGFSYTLL
jgi:hypothetical protein